MSIRNEINWRNKQALAKIPGKLILSFDGKKKSRKPQIMRWIGAKCDCCGVGPNFVKTNLQLRAVS